MLTEPLLDPLGALVTEARSDSDVATLVGTDDKGHVRVNGFEPKAGWKQQAGAYQAFVLISTLLALPDSSIPIQRGTYDIACYGTSPENASALYGAMVKAFHGRRLREPRSGLWLWLSMLETGGEQDRDPVTRQPVVHGVIRIIATAQAVP